MSKKLISRAELKEKGIKAHDSTLWRAERDGKFPRRVHPTPGRVAWFEDEVDRHLENLRAARAASVTEAA